MEENNNSEWHLSKYNIFSTELIDNLIPCVNLLKRTYSELSLEDINYLYNLDKIDKNSDFFNNLIEQGIIVNFDEKEYIKSSLLTNYNNNILTIIIAPSLNCNFSCPYCFENHSDKTVMSLETQNKVINFIKNFLIFSQRKKIKIIWYGGEPLLYPEIIEYISNSLISFCEKNNINYLASMLTNGYYFNQKNVEMLNKCKLTQVQITLDGLEESHNATRFLKNGKGTFSQIIDNLKNVHFNGIISIRHDIHTNNKKDSDSLKELIKQISEESGNKITYYSAPIIDVPAEKSENQVNFLNIKDSIEFELKRRNEQIPNFRITYCSAPSLFFFGIGSKGELYKCWEDFGFFERSYGNIEQWDIRNPLYTANNLDILTKYINSSGILDNECFSCVWLPICAGGCPSKRFFCNMKCLPYVPYKYDINFFIKKIGEYTKNNNNFLDK